MDTRFDVDEHVLPPQAIDDVAAREELGPTLHQQDQEVHRLPFQPDRVAVAAELVGGPGRSSEIAEAECLARIGRRHGSGQALYSAISSPRLCHFAASGRDPGVSSRAFSTATHDAGAPGLAPGVGKRGVGARHRHPKRRSISADQDRFRRRDDRWLRSPPDPEWPATRASADEPRGEAELTDADASSVSDAECSDRTLRGDYAFAIDGTIFTPASSLLLRGVAMTHFDAASGNLSQVDFVTPQRRRPAAPDWRPGTGTYEINPDCTGKAQILPVGAPPLNLRLVVGDRGRQLWTVVIGNATGSMGTRVR